jgi:GR25 family glycosyltransferase involved in LPS biosynthesis
VYSIEGNEYVCDSYQANCCAGYIINKSGVKKALEEIEKNPINAPVDWFVFDAYWKAYREQGFKKVFNSYTIKPSSPEIIKFTINYNLETSFIHATEDMKFST